MIWKLSAFVLGFPHGKPSGGKPLTNSVHVCEYLDTDGVVEVIILFQKSKQFRIYHPPDFLY